MIRFAIQHRTTKHYLALTPSLDVGHRETTDVTDAVSFRTARQAEAERAGIGDFRDVYEVVPVEVVSVTDTPIEAALERRREHDGG